MGLTGPAFPQGHLHRNFPHVDKGFEPLRGAIIFRGIQDPQIRRAQVVFGIDILKINSCQEEADVKCLSWSFSHSPTII